MLVRVEICGVKDSIAYRIRKLRESKDYSQENMAGELGITTSAYSKIERGVTDPSVSRMKEIAGILEVDVTYFFQEPAAGTQMEDANKLYGFAPKTEVEELRKLINKLSEEVDKLKAGVKPKAPAKKKKA